MGSRGKREEDGDDEEEEAIFGHEVDDVDGSCYKEVG